ncbi:MAG: sodium:proton antiporter [Planctomycetaceae bacterium]|nr:sodium:proton antiporter [Planctomycetaceae bacterium]
MELTAPSVSRQDFSRRVVIAAIAATTVLYAGWRITVEGHTASAAAAVLHAASGAASGTAHAAHNSHEAAHAVSPPALYSVIPFIVLLLAIALLPLSRRTEHWWEHNLNRLLVAGGLGLMTLSYYGLLYGQGVLDHTTHQLSAPGWPAAVAVLKNALLVEYIPFITLLFSLYVISGGVSIEGRFTGTPQMNTGIIGIGALLASFIGTTGAAMLLIRPLLQANIRRNRVSHTVVFFIFVVCNTGGCLLPIGDPPLFLGYLRGVSFTWTLGLWPMWLFMNLTLLAVYFLWDLVASRRESPDAFELPPAESAADGRSVSQPRLRIGGGLNFLWLAGVIACVALLDPSKAVPGTHWHAPLYFREVMMLGLTALSLWTTTPEIRHSNAFNYDAILEVAALFTGIFICMQAPIQLLNTWGPQLGFDQPWKYFWGTGLLSSFLDNAPTYVVFFETARTMETSGVAVAGVGASYLVSISLGAVFMGAMTYIGNGPNFMVKAIAEKNNIRMPSFFGYMVYSCLVLLPLSTLLTFLFI